MGTRTWSKRKCGGKKNATSQNLDEENSTLVVDHANQRKIPALIM